MRIVHTESSLGWGGQEIRVLTEAAGLAARGHEVLVLAPREARIFGEAIRRGVPVEPLAIARKQWRGLCAMRGWLAANAIRATDIVNTHSSTDSWLAALACATLERPPAIVRTRHISAMIPNNLPTRWLYTRAAHAIVTTGESLRQQLIGMNHFSGARIFSVPTGIDLARFVPGDQRAARAQCGLPAAGLIVGIVATLRSWKGHRFLIDAIAALKRNDVTLVIVGDGPMRAALESRAAERGLSGRVVMAGNHHDVVPWLQAFDIFALPSYANEGVPQALIQASLTGLAIVTTAIGAIPEVCVADDTAVVVKPQDVDDLARGLAELLGDPAQRARLGQAARARAVGRFGEQAMLDRMEAVFRLVLDDRRGRTAYAR